MTNNTNTNTAITTTMSLDEFLVQNRTESVKAKHDKFYTFSSKRKFDEYLNSGAIALDEVQQANIEYFKQFANVFTFAFDTSFRYVAMTMYYHATKTYRYVGVDFSTQQVFELDSIKAVKQHILQLITDNELQKLNLTTDEKPVETVETTETEPTEKPAKKATKKSK